MTEQEQITDLKYRLARALSALSSMWNQYCPPPWTHSFMSAGEETEDVLVFEHLLRQDQTAIDPIWDKDEVPESYKDLLS